MSRRALHRSASGELECIAVISVKRLIDLTCAGLCLLLGLPLLALTAVAIKVTLGSPMLFRQSRPGQHAKPFTVYKWRTMRDARDRKGDMLPDAERLTRFGRFLRSTSLDELPTLWNVLRGEMSLVGPRPLLPEYLSLYTPEQARRHEVKPGITGWAQVNGRNALTWDEKFALDIWYVDNQSLLLDFRILAMTLWQVVRRHGITSPGEATMPRFTGSAPPPR